MLTTARLEHRLRPHFPLAFFFGVKLYMTTFYENVLHEISLNELRLILSTGPERAVKNVLKL